eukprot:TRINITY_DN58535_c0_g3_i1.p1 TRINITY_DN58535_c0_g3~~TRINITY_DN58535_c0_g3_i1.p1  ORF type:complete len:590 (+),score=25.87 TRINITY_DN58535_c0_g3_i1:253-1770(+)
MVTSVVAHDRNAAMVAHINHHMFLEIHQPANAVTDAYLQTHFSEIVRPRAQEPLPHLRETLSGWYWFALSQSLATPTQPQQKDWTTIQRLQHYLSQLHPALTTGDHGYRMCAIVQHATHILGDRTRERSEALQLAKKMLKQGLANYKDHYRTRPPTEKVSKKGAWKSVKSMDDSQLFQAYSAELPHQPPTPHKHNSKSGQPVETTAQQMVHEKFWFTLNNIMQLGIHRRKAECLQLCLTTIEATPDTPFELTNKQRLWWEYLHALYYFGAAYEDLLSAVLQCLRWCVKAYVGKELTYCIATYQKSHHPELQKLYKEHPTQPDTRPTTTLTPAELRWAAVRETTEHGHLPKLPSPYCGSPELQPGAQLPADRQLEQPLSFESCLESWEQWAYLMDWPGPMYGDSHFFSNVTQFILGVTDQTDQPKLYQQLLNVWPANAHLIQQWAIIEKSKTKNSYSPLVESLMRRLGTMSPLRFLPTLEEYQVPAYKSQLYPEAAAGNKKLWKLE